MTDSLTTTVATSTLSLPDQFPIALTPEQEGRLRVRLDAFDFETMTLQSITTLGMDAELAFNRTLDGFLARINQAESPELFKLVTALNQQVEDEKLPELAQKILHPQPTFMTRLLGLAVPSVRRNAVTRLIAETTQLVNGKSKSLSDTIAGMELKLKVEMSRLGDELKNMEIVKEEYRKNFVSFAEETVFLVSAHGKARAQVTLLEPELAKDSQRRQDVEDKLQALESRALAVEGTLSRLPADQLVIRQLQNAGISTLQELSTTMASRFASIKMTLLTIHGALKVQNVQRLGQQGAALDANLLMTRSALMRDVVGTAAGAPGDNRLAQAKQLEAIVGETQSLVTLVEAARLKNQTQFAEARKIMTQARANMLTLNQNIRP